jgi:hypothetical protein
VDCLSGVEVNKIHTLKTWPQYYKAVVSGEKTFELRKNDRGFKVGDVLVLQEYNKHKEEYTGEMMSFTVTYILTGHSFGVKPGFVIMSIIPETNQQR